MNIQFSLFEGYGSSDLIEPLDYWPDFINDEFVSLKPDSETPTLHFHCCVFAENDGFENDEFLSDFVKKLPFYTMDVNQKHIDFWLLTPELLLIQNIDQDNSYDKVAIALLDTFLKSLSEVPRQENTNNLSDIQKCFINAKHTIAEKGMLIIREEYKIKHEKEFKNKFWL